MHSVKKWGWATQIRKPHVPLLGSKETTLGLGLSSPRRVEASECSGKDPTALDSSNLKCPADPSSDTRDLIATEQHKISMVSPKPSGKLVMVPKVSLATISPMTATDVAGDGGQQSPIRHA